MPAFFDPLSTTQLTRIICRQFEAQEPLHLRDGLPSFTGPGLYAIYYTGTAVDLYKPLRNYRIPLYVGRARSTNSATGRTERHRRPLHRRVENHRRSIIEGGLPIEDFSVRLLALPDVHIDLGENGLRVGYQPVWNAILTGFGSNEQGSSTRRSSRSKWDTLHQGRARTYGATTWDSATLEAEVTEAIRTQIARYRDLAWHTE